MPWLAPGRALDALGGQLGTAVAFSLCVDAHSCSCECIGMNETDPGGGGDTRVPSAHAVSSVQVEDAGGHSRLRVFNRGGLAGVLVLETRDAEVIARRLRVDVDALEGAVRDAGGAEVKIEACPGRVILGDAVRECGALLGHAGPCDFPGLSAIAARDPIMARVEILEQQVRSLQCAAPRGIPHSAEDA